MSKQSAVAKKSPLKERPLRLPGQSIQNQMDDLLDEQILPYLFITFCLVAFTIYEFLTMWFSWERQPYTLLLMTLLALAVLGRKMFVVSRQLRQLRLGRDGERIVAEELDALKRNGCAIYHDICGPGFNLDHVAIGPMGILIIETKTVSKPDKPDAYVIYDGERVTIDGHTPDRNPLDQARAQIRWLRDILKKSTGIDYPVKAAIVYPGWFVKSERHNSGNDVWVLNSKQVSSFFLNERNSLPSDAMTMAAFHLATFIRQSDPF